VCRTSRRGIVVTRVARGSCSYWEHRVPTANRGCVPFRRWPGSLSPRFFHVVASNQVDQVLVFLDLRWLQVEWWGCHQILSSGRSRFLRSLELVHLKASTLAGS
jgi:hypothetical protein